MNTKIKIIKDKIYNGFIKGVYGEPKIPTTDDIVSKVNEITNDDYDPISKPSMSNEFSIGSLRGSFGNVIDDIDVLYKSIESQSSDVYNQLTNSLKENSGSVRELTLLRSEAEDVCGGTNGKDKLGYMFTENFLSLDNINTDYSSFDIDANIPAIDTKAGRLYIPNITNQSIDLSHYYDHKIEITNSDYQGNIINASYIGHSNASVVLNVGDPRRLVYKIKTDFPTRIKSAFAIQLGRNKQPANINQITISLDSSSMNGHIRLYYKKDNVWKDIPGTPVTKITSNKVIFKFNDISTTHIKFEFIKDQPDIIDDNSYYIVIDHISIIYATTSRSATFFSKPISIKSYTGDTPIIGSMSAVIDANIPDGCSVRLAVAKDVAVPGYFVDSNSKYVIPASRSKTSFVKDPLSEFPLRHTLLSDIKKNPDIAGVEDFIGQEFSWINVGIGKEDNMPSSVIFQGTSSKDAIDNTIYQNPEYITFGDSSYTGPWPQDINELPIGSSYEDFVFSGIVNDANPNWSYYQPLVNAGLLVLGMDFGDPTGYPLGYYNPDTDSYWLFGDNKNTTNGWYRPYSAAVTPDGVNGLVPSSIPLPEFRFNGMNFYAVYKFSRGYTPLESTIKLYKYPTGPVGLDTDYYPHNFTWNYKTQHTNETRNIVVIPDGSTPTAGNEVLFSDGKVKIPLLVGEKFIDQSIRSVSYFGRNDSMIIGTHYDIIKDGADVFIDFTKLKGLESFIVNSKISFTYSYVTPVQYKSYWESFIIVSDDSDITINQSTFNYNHVIDSITIKNVDTDEFVINSELKNTSKLDVTLKRGSYNIKIFCLADDSTKKCVNWNPYGSSGIKKGKNIRFVADLKPIKIVDFDTLIFNTQYENNNRAAVYDGPDGFKYLVVKEPSKRIVPGYSFNYKTKTYDKITANQIRNTGHFLRAYNIIDEENGSIKSIKYVTGSQGSSVKYGEIGNPSSYNDDTSWNGGSIWPAGFSNDDTDKLYEQHSTYGNPINIDDIENNKGHLFYDTSENLPAFYTIEYELGKLSDPSKNVFMYKIELTSNTNTATPLVSSVRFTINGGSE